MHYSKYIIDVLLHIQHNNKYVLHYNGMKEISINRRVGMSLQQLYVAECRNNCICAYFNHLVDVQGFYNDSRLCCFNFYACLGPEH